MNTVRKSTLAVGIAQCNLTVGDLEGNVERIRTAYAELSGQGAELVVFPEMAIVGYPPEDLVLRHSVQARAAQAIEKLAAETAGGKAAMLVGGLWSEGQMLHNAAFLLDDGKIFHRQAKVMLPNYGVFDEKRVFAPGGLPQVVTWRGMRLGILVCEDMWGSSLPKHLAAQGAELLIAINASPYEMGKAARRRDVAEKRVKETGLPLIYVNQTGGQDELVFDGRSFVLNHEGGKQVRLGVFKEQLELTRWSKNKDAWLCEAKPIAPAPNDAHTIYQAMVMGLRDYVNKNGFKGVVLGLSGGVDSALSAAIAVDALGAARVKTVMMPSPYTSTESLEDAAHCAKLLGVELDTIAIDPGMQALSAMLQKRFAGKTKDTTEENIQSRLRGMVLMAISNKEGLMVLTTGNKSEMSMGYATLYGDMCGGYSVLKDLYKTTLYKVCDWRSRHKPENALGPSGEVIPARVISKAPSAELKPNQKDEDSLPPYALLDAILLRLVEQQLGVDDIVKEGYDRATVERVARLLNAAEYKRRQAPPGVKITGMSFGRDRRYPITNRFEE